jgi:methyltransferase (TIGR00027 family)
MLPGQASQTMVSNAVVKAAHQLLDRPVIFEDPIAVGLVAEASKQLILDAADEHRTPMRTLLRGTRILSSRFAEDRLAQAAARGVGQYVILRAGLDTFAWRQPQFAQRMRIFYVDHPATLGWSMERFRERDLRTPPNLSWVAADLEKPELETRLDEHGFDRAVAAFGAVLGVTQYISRNAVEALLGVAASWQEQSEIVLSFQLPADELDGEDRAAAIRGSSAAAAKGEPFITSFRPAEIFDLLTRLGFGEVFHLTPKRAQQRYFAGRNDLLRAPRHRQLIAGIV